ncbi:MAG: Lsr2 protein [Frankiales bacterium]|nr:Lsr2 protein [Frankiales bacterium]
MSDNRAASCEIPEADERPGMALLRVSDENRRKYESTLSTDLDWLTWNPVVRQVRAMVVDAGVDLFRKGPRGDELRARCGMVPTYAPGTSKLIGGELTIEGWHFVFLLVTAAKADLGPERNSATEVIRRHLRELAAELGHIDPHDPASRLTLYAHALDRILRNELFAWQVFDTLVETYALVDAAGTKIDVLAQNSKAAWTLATFGAAGYRDEVARKFLVKRLNRLRAGDWSGNELGLPHAFRASCDLDSNGRWNIDPDEDERMVWRPEPDPRQRWAVQRIAELFDSPLSFRDIAIAAGRAGITSKGVDERGQTLDVLRDKSSAGRLLLTPEKIRAYATGQLRHTETGVTPGQFSPGDGHKLVPRWPGDRLGAITGDVRLGLPEGWDWDVPAERWRRILERRFLPAGFVPDGWSWTDPASSWGWPQILTACDAVTPARQPSGRLAGNQLIRPLSGLMSWSAGTHRHLVHCRGGNRERYEWRAEELATARRDARGELYEMGKTDGSILSSWPVEELHVDGVADLLLAGVQALLADGTPLAPLAPIPAVAAAPDPGTAAEAERLRTEIAKQTKRAAGFRELAADRRVEHGPDDPDVRQYLADADTARRAADASQARLDRLTAEDRPAPADAVEIAQFEDHAAVYAALTGPFRSGPAPKALHYRLADIFGDSLRLEVVDAASARLLGTVTARTVDGGIRSWSGSVLLGRSRLRRARRPADGGLEVGGADLREDRFTALADGFWTGGWTFDEFLERARSTDRVHWHKRLRTRVVDQVPHPGLQLALLAHPLPGVRGVVCGAGWAEFPEPFRQLLHEIYCNADLPWGEQGFLDPAGERRLDVLAMWRALPDLGSALPTQHVAELTGVSVRAINALATDVRRGRRVIPATLARPGGWGGKRAGTLSGDQRTVALPACPWADCDSPVADAVVTLPEVVIGAGTVVLCRSCLRPPTRDIVFPDAYRDVIAANDAAMRDGAWVRCGAGCTLDLGAGPGLLWRWSDDRGPATRHEACRTAAAA